MTGSELALERLAPPVTLKSNKARFSERAFVVANGQESDDVRSAGGEIDQIIGDKRLSSI